MRLPLPELPGPGETKGRPRCHPLQWARLPTGVRREAPDWWITRVSNAKNVYNIPEELSIDFESTIQSLPAITDRASPCAELFRPVGAQQSSTGRAHTRCGEAPVRLAWVNWAMGDLPRLRLHSHVSAARSCPR